LREDPEQRVQDSPQHSVQIDGAAEGPGNLQDGLELLRGSSLDVPTLIHGMRADLS